MVKDTENFLIVPNAQKYATEKFKYIIMEVKIIKCSYPHAWYKDSIGEKYNVVWDGTDYLLKEDEEMEYGFARFINPNDCELCE